MKLKKADGSCRTSCESLELDKGDECSKLNNEQSNHSEDFSNANIIQIILGTAFFLFAAIFDLQNKEFLFLASYLLVSYEVVVSVFKNLKKKILFDENFLMGIASLGAFAIGKFEEAIAVLLFYQVGEYLQNRAVERSKKSISSLMDIRPDFANVKTEQTVVQKSVDDVCVGEIIIIKPGERVPLDCTVLSGSSSLDTSTLTGESSLRDVDVDDKILAGMINLSGTIVARVDKLIVESAVTKILDLVQNASSKKAKTEKFITKFARYYTPVVVYTAIAVVLIPPLLTGGSFQEWLMRGLIFLVISCPCALVISIPLGFLGAIGASSRKGVLVKGGNYLEALNHIDTIVFDKTGTLTDGKGEIFSVNPSDSFSEEELIHFAAHAECFSNHPIANAIKKLYDKEVDVNLIQSYKEYPGYGVLAEYEGRAILAGNAKHMTKNEIVFQDVNDIGTIIHVAVAGVYCGYLVFSDALKAGSASTVSALKAYGIKQIIMLTGDYRQVAQKVASEIGIGEVYPELLPNQKVELLESIRERKESNGSLLFVGDGINDAPSLMFADVGIAMGGIGSDAAIEAADIVILNDDPREIITAVKIAKKTRRIVWQNIIFALAVKVFFLSLGVLGVVTMWEAVFADVGVMLIAVMNSSRLLKVDDN